MKAFVFSGQGSQVVGMGKSLIDTSDVAKEIIFKADDILGYSLSDLMFHGPIETLTKTKHAQPALVTISIAMLKTYLKENQKPIEDLCSFVAGHSLGEYSALVAAGVLNFEDALKLVELRGNAMQNAHPEGEGSMAAVLGLDIKAIEDCMPDDETCIIANDNAPGQIVISGSLKSLQEAIDKLMEQGAKRCILLPVSAPFHSPFMKKAQDTLLPAIDAIDFKDPVIPVISNVIGKPLTSGSEIKHHLKIQICSRVRWRESILHLKQEGVQEIIEIGSGSVLTGLNKRIAPDIISTSYQCIKN